MNGASPAIPVRIIGDDELVQNGGQYLVEGRPAIPLLGGTAETINSGDATEGQVLTADGAGGAGWASLVQLLEVPPDGSSWIYNFFGALSPIPGDTWTDVDLSEYLSNASVAFLVIIVGDENEAGGNLNFRPSETATALELYVPATGQLVFSLVMPLVNDAFQIRISSALGLSGQMYLVAGI